jgi:hypothetical protein
MAMEAYENKTECEVIFDTNSKPVGIDNCASAYISGDIDDFEGKLEETNRVIKGFGGTSAQDRRQRWQSSQGPLAKQLLCTEYQGKTTLSTALVKRTSKARQERSS